MARAADEDSSDTIRVQKLDLAEEAAAQRPRAPSSDDTPVATPAARRVPLGKLSDPGAPGSKFAHTHAPEDLTPLPPPRVLASMIAEESQSGLTPPGLVTPPPGFVPPGLVMRAPTEHTGPLPLPPVPSAPRPDTARPLERASLGPRRLALPGIPTAEQLVDPSDHRWTVALWGVGALLSAALLGWTVVALAAGIGRREVPTPAVVVLALLLLLYPLLFLLQVALASRVRTAGIELGAEQLTDEWNLYQQVAEHLGIRKAPPLFLYDPLPGERRLLALVRGRCLTVPRAAVMSRDTFQIAVGRELGSLVARHDTLLDAALLAAPRLVFVLVTGWLRFWGLGLSPLYCLRQARAFTQDRAAAVGAGQLGLVLDDVVGAGSRPLAVRIDIAQLEAQLDRRHPLTRLVQRLTSPDPPPAERTRRLAAFAAPHLVRE